MNLTLVIKCAEASIRQCADTDGCARTSCQRRAGGGYLVEPLGVLLGQLPVDDLALRPLTAQQLLQQVLEVAARVGDDVIQQRAPVRRLVGLLDLLQLLRTPQSQLCCSTIVVARS